MHRLATILIVVLTLGCNPINEIIDVYPITNGASIQNGDIYYYNYISRASNSLLMSSVCKFSKVTSSTQVDTTLFARLLLYDAIDASKINNVSCDTIEFYSFFNNNVFEMFLSYRDNDSIKTMDVIFNSYTYKVIDVSTNEYNVLFRILLDDFFEDELDAFLWQQEYYLGSTIYKVPAEPALYYRTY